MSKSTEHTTWQRLSLILDELMERCDGGDLSGKSHGKAFEDIKQIILEEKEAARQEAMKVILADISGPELDAIIDRSLKAYELIMPLRKLKDMGKRRRTNLFADYIDEKSIKSSLSDGEPKDE